MKTVKVTVNYYFKRIDTGVLVPRVYCEEIKNLPSNFSSEELSWSTIMKNGRPTFIIHFKGDTFEIQFKTVLQFDVSEQTFQSLQTASHEEIERIRLRVQKNQSPEQQSNGDGLPF